MATNQADSFNLKVSHPLQSWEWGEFRKEWGNLVVRKENYQIIFSQIPKTNLTVGTLIRGGFPTPKMIKEVKEIGKEKKAIFIKLEPNFIPTQKERKQKEKDLLKMGLIKGKHLFTPQSFFIDLTKSEEELLSSFHPKTRYNIRYAQRKGVKIEEDNSEKAFKEYLKLTFETAKRQNFYAHTPLYHKLMWKHLHINPLKEKRKPIAHLLVAKYKKRIIASWIVFAFKDFLYYPYGASDYRYHKLMASNLMMWEAIRFGKKLGLKTFDLWGKEEGKGFTRFKEGYNPKVVEFIGSWDLVINRPLYKLYLFVNQARWIILKKILPAFR
jgi:lipid II:glycine glycyltransferase (peptidoglycan interpeptide bridge formation enzyme)